MKKKIFLLVSLLCLGLSSAMAEQTDLATTSFATEGNISVTGLTNDATYPWKVDDDGSIVNTNSNPSSNYNYASFTVTFTSEEEMVLTFSWYNGGSSNDRIEMYIDGSSSYSLYQYGSTGSYTSGNAVYYFLPGEHSLTFKSYRYSTSYSGIDNIIAVKNFKLVTPESQYKTINNTVPGNLGLEALNVTDALPNLQYLKLTGSLNTDDWATIKKMTGLRALDMSGTTVTEIPASAFTSNSFRFFKFPTNCTTIGDKAFYDRYLYGKLELPTTVTSIGQYAFYSNSITEVTLPASVTSVGSYAFQDNDNLTSFTFGGGLTAIPPYMLQGCASLTTVKGCTGITDIGEEAFSQCRVLKTIDGLKATTIGNYAFYYCFELTDFDFSEVTTIGCAAFAYCYGLTTVKLPKLQSFHSSGSCFSSCDGITDVVIPDAVTSIPSGCFSSCKSLKNITIGSGCTSIGTQAFYSSYCNIENVYVSAPTPPSVGTNIFYQRTGTLYVPSYAMKSYKLDDYWSQFTTVEENPNPVGDLVIAGNLLLSSGDRIPNTPNVTMYRGSSFEILGTQAQPLGKFTALFATSSNATLINHTPDMTSTASEIRYYMNTGYWYFVCMPFDVKVADITSTVGAQIAIRYYDGAQRATYGTGSSWRDVATDGTLKAGKGYIFRVSVSGGYVCMPATADTHNKIFASEAIKTTLETHTTEVSADKSWNLVGNPYAAYYDILRMDYTAPITVWSTSDNTYTAYSIADDELALLPLQAFFVQKPDLVDGITFQPEGRQKTSTIDHSAGARALAGEQNAVSDRKVVNLTLSNGKTTDKTRVVVNPQQTDDFDAETDATKMLSQEGTAQIYSLVDGEMYSINEGCQQKGSVDLGMWFPADGQYTIDVTRADTKVELLDNGTAVEMPYTFNANEGYCESRFVLSIDNTATSIETVHSQPANGGNAIYNVAGQRIDAPQKGVNIINGKKVLK